MLAGGDLDGDIYCLVKDSRLHPSTEFEPASYEAPERVKIDTPSTATELAQFVVDFIKVRVMLHVSNNLIRFCRTTYLV